MSETSSNAASDVTGAPDQKTDPKSVLSDPKAADAAKKKARKAVSEAAAKRPWEQLAAMIKAAARADARRLLENAGSDEEALTGAGYSRQAARHLLGDLGRQ